MDSQQGDFPYDQAPFEKQIEELKKRLEDCQTALLFSNAEEAISSEEKSDTLPSLIAQTLSVLQEAESRYRSLTEVTSVAIFIIDGPKILFANPAAQRLTGYGGDDLQKIEFPELAHPDYRTVLKQYGVANQWSQNIPSRYELKIITRNRSERWLDVTAGPISYQRKPAILLTAFDITERDQAEKELKTAKAELEVIIARRTRELHRVNQQVDKANHALSHELAENEQLLKQLENERSLWKTTVESLPALVTICDAQGIATYMNPTYKQLVNLVVDPSLNLDEHPAYYRIYHPDGAPFEAADLPLQKAALYDEVVENVELVHQLRSGEKRHVIFDAAPLHDSDGHLLGAVAIGRDITEQRRVEAEREHLLSQLAFQAVLLANVHDSIFSLDENLNFTSWNPAAEELYGWSASEVAGKSIDLLRPGITPEQRAELRRILHERGRFSQEIVNYARDGRMIQVEMNISVLRGPDGEATGYVAANKDITRRKQAEETSRKAYDELDQRVKERTKDLTKANQELSVEIASRKEAESQARRNAARADTLVRVASRLNAQLDLEQVVKLVCEETAAALNVPAVYVSLYDETLGGFSAVSGFGIPAETLKRIPFVSKSAFEDIIQHLGVMSVVLDVRNLTDAANGGLYREMDIRTVVGANMLREGKPVGGLIILTIREVRNFTEDELTLLQGLANQAAGAIINARLYKDLENSLVEEQAIRGRLIQAEKHTAMSRMVASVAHEINNPLQTIKNCLYLTEQEVQEGPVLDYLQMATSEVRRISNLVSQLREVYRPVRVEPTQHVDLSRLLEEVHALVMPHLQFHRVEWNFSPSTEELAVRASSDELKQVFLNISLNAIEAMQATGGSLIVSLQTQEIPGAEIDGAPVKKSPGVGVAFKDTGPGIPVEALPRIFDPFYTTKETGNGLGLAICYDIVKRLNGQITVESQLGSGATFTVWLPVAVDG